MSAVLIVDDSPADRALFRTILTRAGYVVHEVSRGGEALAKACAIRPHAVILDLNLPDTDGYAVCRALRAERETASVPILMLSVLGRDEDVVAGLEAGADDYVSKDSPREIILARLKRLIQFRQMATVAVLNEQLVQVGRLLAGIVHEIRGPLAVIRGSAELMRFHIGPGDPTHQWIDPILRNVQVLQLRLEHLMATVRSGPAVLEPLDLPTLLRESADLFHKGTDPRGVQVGVDLVLPETLPPVLGDPGKLLQVLLSLFGNAHEALSAVRADGRIAIRARVERNDDRDWVTIEVSDNGPGIPEAYLERIFEPYFTTKETGSGYGLYLASEILREQGGRLTVCNLTGGGACFTVWLPVAEAAAPAT